MPILFIIIPFLILAGGIFYVGRRLISPFELSGRSRRILWCAIAAWGMVMYLSLFMGQTDGPWRTPLSWIGYVSLGLLSFLFFGVLLRDVILLLAWAASKLRSLAAPKKSAPHTEIDQSRRTHLQQATSLGAIGLAAVLTSYGVYEARRRPGIIELTVPIADLPPAFEGFRIVQLTDIHAGLTVGRDWIDVVAEETDALHPDLIAFTGDLVDGSVGSLRDVVAPFGELKAPYGKFFITGNHEYYSGAKEWVNEAGRLGYDVLLNEHRLIERNGARLVLAGITDYSAVEQLASHRSDPEGALRDAPSHLRRILLAHQPKSLRQTTDIDFDLMLSGHTHGGQFFPWNLASAADQPYVYGLHRHEGKWVYVSRGTGYWGPPVRLAARSEITVVKLVREA